jgi:hypothetical protein
MKDKEKQIEEKRIQRKLEMTKDISNGISGVLAYEIQKLAEHLISLNYVKLPKDSVVLSREEYTNYIVEYMGVKEIKERVSKETAEEFLQLAYDRCLEKSFIKKVEELAKHFGVEIKE